MYSQKLRSIIESKLEEIEKRCLKEEETYTKLKMIVLEIKEEITRKKGKEGDRNAEENKDKKDMHGIQNVEDQNESTKEVVVNDNKENKHIVQHINEPEEEVLVENNTNKDKELDAPDMKKHGVDNDYKEDECIQHYNDEYKYDTNREESEVAISTRKEGRP